MVRNWIIALLLLTSGVLFAQLNIVTSLSYDYGHSDSIQGIDTIIIFEKMDVANQLAYDLNDTSDVEWVYQTLTIDSLISSSVKDSVLKTQIDSLEEGLYKLRIKNVDTISFYVVDFSQYQSAIDTVWVDDSGDSCNYVRLNASLDKESVSIYNKANDSTYLLNSQVTTFEWIGVANDTLLTTEAPLEDITYRCLPYADDFFLDNSLSVRYIDADTVDAEKYTAIAVKILEFTPSVNEVEEFSNLLDTSTVTGLDVEGTAPFDVTCDLSPSSAVEYISWWVWSLDTNQPNSPTYRYQEQMTHTFVKYVEEGYQIEVEVGNDFCIDTTEVSVKVWESDLKVPNILVLGFGATEGGQFKVAHKSIDPASFKAAIYNRWGRKIHQWEDPNVGWDGRSSITNSYVSPGPYYYIIQAEGTDGKEYTEKGDLSIIREKGAK